MKWRVLSLLGAYALLLALLAAEYFASFLPLGGHARLALLAVALAMAGVLMTQFMELRRAGAPAVMFVIAAALWLVILLGLGTLDPVTRAMYPAPESAVSASMKAPATP